MKTDAQPGRSGKRKNGYALEPALLAFSLVLLLCAWAVLCLQSKSALLQAARRSSLDLAVLDRAREYAGECSWARRCAVSAPASAFTETIEGIPVQFRDETTLVHADYKDGSARITLEIFYDTQGILRVEYR